MDREIKKATDEDLCEWGVSCLYSDKSTRFRRKGEFVEKEAWVEILFQEDRSGEMNPGIAAC